MKRIKIGIVGLNFGRWIIEELLRHPGCALFEIAGVCDFDPARAADMAAKTGARVFTNLDQLLADEDILAIGLFTGPEGRAELIRRIVRAGRDVITTKPFELDPGLALEVLREARALGRVVHLNSPPPQLPEDLRIIQAWRDRFQLGQPVACRAEITASYREKADGGWYDDPVRCPVAPIFRLGIYLINDLITLVGEPQDVQVLQSRLFTGRPTPDNAQLAISFKNGAIGNIFASFCINDGQYYSNSLTLNFENGTIYRNIGPNVFPGPKLRMVAQHGESAPIIETADFTEHSGGYQWETFHRAVRGEKIEGETSPEQIVAGIKLISAMARAEKSQRMEAVL
jgi:predicted dehydrogenase